MKVYYEKPKAENLISNITSLANQYENVTGKAPNRVKMTQEEFDIIYEHLSCCAGFRIKESSDIFKNQIYGMEIVIED